MNGLRAVCFVDMPFGKKADLASGIEVDFDQVYELAIQPAIEAAGLQPIRGDRERSGGIIHAPMFGRLLLSDFVVADLTLSNPNVFYELGIRHTARPFTTVPIFSPIHSLPFDVGLVRAIPYHLEAGKLTEASAEKLRSDLRARLDDAVGGVASHDSPLFQLIPNFPRVNLPHDVTEIFQDQVRHSEEFRNQLSRARAHNSDADRLQALQQIENNLGDLKVTQGEILVDLLLSYRDVSAWNQMVDLVSGFSDYLKSNLIVRQQYALALNRRNDRGDREEAVRILTVILKENGPDPETLGILGRLHKDRYRELSAKASRMAPAALDAAIEAYTRGFEADPRDYFPGVNALTLLIEKGDAKSLQEAKRLEPLVSFAVARRGGAASSDYWDLATVLELSAISGDATIMDRTLPKVLDAGKESWKIKTTMGNLQILKAAQERAGQPTEQLQDALVNLEQRYLELCGPESLPKQSA